MEVLAPAGSMEMAKAAVHAGCDAIYCGGDFFGARAYAENFSLEAFKELIHYCHERKVKVYITLNTLIKNKEMAFAFQYAQKLYTLGVDAIIVQDIGLVSILTKVYPEMILHGSTQMTLLNTEALFWADKMGIKRGILPRELSLEEIQKMRRKTNLELEVFVHGSLCVCVSGQCLMSSFIGKRSGNRGRCAQPCRMDYESVAPNGKIIGTSKALNVSDLYTLHRIGELLECRIDSIKIEGRMKKAEYVFAAVKNYKAALENKNTDSLALREVSHRDFTEGLLFHAFGEKYYQSEFEKRRPVAKIIYKRHKIYLEFLLPVFEKDILEIQSASGRTYPLTMNENYNSGEFFSSEYFQDALQGSKVFRIFSGKLRREMETALKEEKSEPVILRFSGEIGEPAILCLEYMGHIFKAFSDEIEIAQNKGLEKERILEQLKKTGEEPLFFIEDIHIDFPMNAYLPISQINRLRRSVFGQLHDFQKNKRKRRLELKEYSLPLSKTNKGLQEVEYVLEAKDYSQLIDLDLSFFKHLYLYDLEGMENIIFHGNIYYAPGLVMERDFHEIIHQFEKYKKKLRGIVAEDLGVVHYCQSRKIPFMGGQGLNILNTESVNLLAENADGILLSAELNGEEIKDILSRSNGKLQLQLYGDIKMMQLRSCPFSVIKKCKDATSCSYCSYSKGHLLRDRKGAEFNFSAQKGWFTLSSSNISLIREKEKLISWGIHQLKISIIQERAPKKCLENIIKEYDFNDSQQIKSHFYRGIE